MAEFEVGRGAICRKTQPYHVTDANFDGLPTKDSFYFPLKKKQQPFFKGVLFKICFFYINTYFFPPDFFFFLGMGYS